MNIVSRNLGVVLLVLMGIFVAYKPRKLLSIVLTLCYLVHVKLRRSFLKNSTSTLCCFLHANTKVNRKKVDKTVKEQTFSLMEVEGLEGSEKVVLGTLLTGIKTETS